MVKKILLIMVGCLSLVFNINMVKAAPVAPLSTEIFQWVQETPRANYYFNKKVMVYEVNPEGYINTKVLIVPTVKIYDDTEIKDITMKRQWREESTHRIGELAASAEFLKFNLQNDTVSYMDNEYLDRGYNPLNIKYQRPEVDIKTMSHQNVNYHFYQTILDYAKEHKIEILQRMLEEGNKLTPEELKAYNLTPDGKLLPTPQKHTKKSKKTKK